ncbi:hypothetical protein [Halapricum hydrolyticum]|uniref:Uncharacterized protein n=1 Tax=Halapricum hydrolyticum TaxID=2979991 RepID=A0AAE3I931_9EURY|nr:hypothetical protein [Halapricum hydrolyticum]MCU4716808.1 hypothetical protein [Halapricum hydrolyticum]MCU4725587.1 hypothetical protein [Halapricum hydrolyticum]
MQTNTKLYGTLAAIMLATLAIVGLTATGGAVVATENVTIDDPTNDTVEVDVDYSSSLTSSINATAELVNSSGTVVDSQTISSMNATETFTLSASEAGDYEINVTAEDETNTTVAETRVVASRTATIEDATTETLTVDLGFQGSTNATATVNVTDSTGSSIYRTTVDYTGTDTTKTLTLNDTDGLVNDTLTVTSTFNPASAYDGAYATVDDGSTDSILGGTIAGQDTGVVLAVVIVAILGYLYVRRED